VVVVVPVFEVPTWVVVVDPEDPTCVVVVEAGTVVELPGD
jgi:hypothetical protein